MNLKIKTIFYFFFVSFISFSHDSDTLSRVLSNCLTNFPENTQLSVAIIHDGVPKFYGVIKKNDQIVFENNETKLFEIGSITKIFTATILAQLITDGKIKSNATVDQFVKFKLHDKTKIKLTELANHTSGLPPLPFNFVNNQFVPNNPYKNYTVSDLESYLKNELKLNSPPGKNYNYSNLGAGLLGYILGVSQKKSYFDLLQSLIFDHYKLTNTFTFSKNEQNLVSGLDKDGKETSNWDFDALAGAGCVVSCTKDLATFTLAQFENNATLNLTHSPTFTISENMKIALGWHLITQDSIDYIWHNGGTGGYSSSMALNLKNKSGVIVLSNIPPNRKVDDLCFELMRLF